VSNTTQMGQGRRLQLKPTVCSSNLHSCTHTLHLSTCLPTASKEQSTRSKAVL
jgi:hypothetical protein